MERMHKMKAAIIVDSTASLSDELRAHADIYQVDLSLNFKDGESLTDSTADEQIHYFYDKLVKVNELPTTSQPEPGEYIKIFDEIVNRGYDTVFMYLLSGALSGTYQTGRMVSEDYRDRLSIHCIDSKGVSVYTEHLVIEALKMLEAGLSETEIVEESEWIIANSTIYVAIKDLNNLVKGGRLSSAQAFLGTMLKVYPIVKFTEEGSLEIMDKVRSIKKVRKTYENIFDKAMAIYDGHLVIGFAHGDAAEETEQLRQDLLANHPEIESRIKYLTPVVGTHGGKGCIGMATMAKARFNK